MENHGRSGRECCEPGLRSLMPEVHTPKKLCEQPRSRVHRGENSEDSHHPLPQEFYDIHGFTMLYHALPIFVALRGQNLSESRWNKSQMKPTGTSEWS